MKRILIIITAAAVSVSHAQEKTFRYLQNGSQSVWIDEDIIGDANRTGVARALQDMELVRKEAAVRAAAGHNTFLQFDRIELWFEKEGRRRHPDNSLVSTTWSTTAWNAFVYTIDGHQDWVAWYRSLPGHANFTIDD